MKTFLCFMFFNILTFQDLKILILNLKLISFTRCLTKLNHYLKNVLLERLFHDLLIRIVLPLFSTGI
jgi:hypothetical protein